MVGLKVGVSLNFTAGLFRTPLPGHRLSSGLNPVRTKSGNIVMIKASVQLFTIPTTAVAGLLIMFVAIPVVASPDCENLKGCDRKFCEIEQQINIAAESNDRKTDGLKIALEEVRLHCTDKGLRENLVEEIQEAKADMAEYEADLKESEEDGDMGDVRKYQRKIEEEKQKILRLEGDLSNLD